MSRPGLLALSLVLPCLTLAAEPLPGPFTLQTLVREVLVRHPTAAAAQASVEAAGARTRASGTLMDPMISYSMAPLSIGSHHPYGQTIRLSQRLPFFGKRGAEKNAARAEETMREAERLTVHEQLALTAASRFADLYALHHALEIHREHRALLEELRQSAEARYRSGLAPQHAVLEAEMALAELDAEELEHEGMRAAMVAELNALLRRPPEAPLPPPVVQVELGKATAVAPSKQAHEHATTHYESKVSPEQRPELLAMRAEEEMATAELDRARRESYPDFELMGEYSSMWAEPTHQFMIGIGIEIPLQLGRRSAMRDEASAMLSRARHQRTQMEEEIRAERAAAGAQLAAALARARVQEQRLVPLSTSRVAATRAAFLTGQASLSDLLEAERAQREAEIAFHASLAEVVRRQAALRRAEGTLTLAPETSR